MRGPVSFFSPISIEIFSESWRTARTVSPVRKTAMACRPAIQPISSAAVTETGSLPSPVRTRAAPLVASRAIDCPPSASAIAGDVGGFACVLNFGDIPPGIGLAAVEIGEAVDLRQLTAPARHLGVLRERRHGPADEGRALGDGEVGILLCRVAPVRFGDAIRLEHGL